MNKRTWWILGSIAAVVWLGSVLIGNPKAPPAPSRESRSESIEPVPTIEVDAALIKRCRELIRTARREGVLGEIRDGDRISYATILPDFYLLDFKTKEGICRAISYMGKAAGTDGHVILRDSRTNEKVGTFNDMIGSLEWSGGRR